MTAGYSVVILATLCHISDRTADIPRGEGIGQSLLAQHWNNGYILNMPQLWAIRAHRDTGHAQYRSS